MKTNSTPAAPDLHLLSDTYDVLGELRGREDGRFFLATRRGDAIPVLIGVAEPTDSRPANCVAELAADARLIIAQPHPQLLKILDVRPIENGAVAVITDRPRGPALAESLGRHEPLPSSRIADILRQVYAVLLWAREQGIRHRVVTARTITIDKDVGRILVSLSFATKQMGRAGLDPDAATIAALAWEMLVGGPPPQNEPALVAAGDRRGLPHRVLEQTAAFLLGTGTNDGARPSVVGYISCIALADSLVAAESEAKRIVTTASEEHSSLKRALEANRAEVEQDLARQRAELEAFFASERAEIDRFAAEERERLAKERADLTAFAAAERARLADERAAFERDRAEAEESWARAQLRLDATESDSPAPELVDESANLAPVVSAAAPPLANRFNRTGAALAGALLILFAIVAGASMQIGARRAAANTPIPAPAVANTPTTPDTNLHAFGSLQLPTRDSAGGNVVSVPSTDSVIMKPDTAAAHASVSIHHVPVHHPRPDSTTASDSLRRDSSARHDTIAHQDTIVR